MIGGWVRGNEGLVSYAAVSPVWAAGRGGGLDFSAGDKCVKRIGDAAPAGPCCCLQLVTAGRVDACERLKDALGEADAVTCSFLSSQISSRLGQTRREPVAAIISGITWSEQTEISQLTELLARGGRA
jgi:hypothetical protein